jgi:hypothetical protein
MRFLGVKEPYPLKNTLFLTELLIMLLLACYLVLALHNLFKVAAWSG